MNFARYTGYLDSCHMHKGRKLMLSKSNRLLVIEQDPTKNCSIILYDSYPNYVTLYAMYGES